MPYSHDFDDLPLCLDAVEDAVIKAEDFPDGSMTVPRKRGADMREGFQDHDVIKQSPADLHGSLRIILGYVIPNFSEVIYCRF